MGWGRMLLLVLRCMTTAEARCIEIGIEAPLGARGGVPFRRDPYGTWNGTMERRRLRVRDGRPEAVLCGRKLRNRYRVGYSQETSMPPIDSRRPCGE